MPAIRSDAQRLLRHRGVARMTPALRTVTRPLPGSPLPSEHRGRAWPAPHKGRFEDGTSAPVLRHHQLALAEYDTHNARVLDDLEVPDGC